jgi:DNA mismatch endonuclease (patch repair protein)
MVRSAGSKERRHRGDFMSPEARSVVMSRIRGKGTGPELLLATELRVLGLQWEEHARDLPGCPDFVFRRARLVVFVDGDFWHGYRFANWRDKLSEKWEAKIAGNISRDRRKRAALRELGWRVIRIWEHQVLARPSAAARRVHRALSAET